MCNEDVWLPNYLIQESWYRIQSAGGRRQSSGSGCNGGVASRWPLTGASPLLTHAGTPGYWVPLTRSAPPWTTWSPSTPWRRPCWCRSLCGHRIDVDRWLTGIFPSSHPQSSLPSSWTAGTRHNKFLAIEVAIRVVSTTSLSDYRLNDKEGVIHKNKKD